MSLGEAFWRVAVRLHGQKTRPCAPEQELIAHCSAPFQDKAGPGSEFQKTLPQDGDLRPGRSDGSHQHAKLVENFILAHRDVLVMSIQVHTSSYSIESFNQAAFTAIGSHHD